MSDPPPKKVGSLRDRIAAFENKGTAPTPAPAPAPRPKPGHIAWTPKPTSPPASPSARGDSSQTPVRSGDDTEGAKRPGMSASDAKESIGKLSLKERMAALQGSVAFGGGSAAGTPPPRPVGEKPKWKPPPVVQRVEPVGGEDEDEHEKEKKQPRTLLPAPAEAPADEDNDKQADEVKSPAAEGDGEGESKEQHEPDPEEEERARRAALATRMARLGGARVGMGPPIFGKKPDILPKKMQAEGEPRDEEEKPAEVSPSTKVAHDSPTVQEAAAIALPPSTDGSTNVGVTDYFAVPERQDSTSSTTLSPDSAGSPPPVRSPAMPVPQGPKRAAPPRKRLAKSPARPPPVVEEEVQESPAPLATTEEASSAGNAEKAEPVSVAESAEPPPPHGDREPEVTESQVETVAIPQAHEGEAIEETAASAPVPETLHDGRFPQPSEVVIAEGHASHDATDQEELHREAADLDEESQLEDAAADEDAQSEGHADIVEAPKSALVAEEDEEDDEATRRKRIAERLAKAGGFNPFAGGVPPPAFRKDSADSTRSPVNAPPAAPPLRRDSRQESDENAARSPSPRRETKSELSERNGNKDLSSDGGVSAEPQAFEQSTLAHDESIKETPGDRDVHPRGEHEAGHTHPASFTDEYEHEDHEAYKHESRENDKEPETIQEVEIESIARQPPLPIAPRPLPTVPQWEADEDNATSPPPPPRRNLASPPSRVVVPPPPPTAKEERSPEVDKEEAAYAEHARDIGAEHDEDEDEEEDEHISLEEEENDRRAYLGERDAPVEDTAADEAGHDKQDEDFDPPPPPRHAALPHRAPPPAPVPDEDQESFDPPPPPPPRRVSLKMPSRPMHAPPPPIDHDQDEDEKGDEALDLPPPPPRRVSIPPPPRHTPLYNEQNEDEVRAAEEPDETSETEELVPPPHPTRQARPISQSPTTTPQPGSHKPILPVLHNQSPEHEVLDDSDVDPIDPEFYTPQRSAGSGSLPTPSPRHTNFPSLASPPLPPSQVLSPPLIGSPPPPPPPPPPRTVVSPSLSHEHIEPPLSAVGPTPPPLSGRPHVAPAAPEQQDSSEEDEEDAELARRRTIADRMAKLGGLRFGAPPPVPAARRPQPPAEGEEENEESEKDQQPVEAQEPAPEVEEDEFARKQRIAARIAGMGGMRFGMLPGAAAPRPPPRVQRDEEEESAMSPRHPKRSAPVPPPPPQPAEEAEHEEEYQHMSDSDHVGHEESELEEVTYTDAEEEAPPIPDRHGRRVSTGPPLVPQPRTLSPPSLASPLPVPRTRPRAPPAFTYPPPPPQAPPTPATHETQGDFVLVDQAEGADEPPPPPPPRAARPPPRAPPRALPPAPERTNPSIPNIDIDFGAETDLSLSGQWSEDSTSYPVPPDKSPAAPAAQEQPPPPTRAHPAERHFTPDELMAVWGHVGVQVHEIAAAFFEKSKKSVVGDGSYLGFVHSVLSQVPIALQPTESLDSFGYLVYRQTSAAVQRRVSDIMPGDVIVVYDAKFKGHKGLQSYSHTVGVGEPLVGVIGEFETKKSKVKVFHANQHVGQQSVESVSYRLEDMKSGQVKIFRILEQV